MIEIIEKIVNKDLNSAQKIDLYMKNNGISNRWVADNLNVHISLISKIRLGNAAITKNNLQKINELFKTDY